MTVDGKNTQAVLINQEVDFSSGSENFKITKKKRIALLPIMSKMEKFLKIRMMLSMVARLIKYMEILPVTLVMYLIRGWGL
ncbi:hypothetical protein HNQ74_000507 [Bartonella doshiae]|nr:hypothetical protein [Bartonella doshiae]